MIETETAFAYADTQISSSLISFPRKYFCDRKENISFKLTNSGNSRDGEGRGAKEKEREIVITDEDFFFFSLFSLQY